MKREKHELSYHARMLAAKLRRGHYLFTEVSEDQDARDNHALLFILSETNKKCGQKAALELVTKGKITPAEDGLFAGFSQTYRWAGGDL